MKVFKLFSAFTFVFFFFFVHQGFAQTEGKVTSAVHMSYNVSESGSTHVTAHIALTNTTDNFYVSSYALTLGFTTLSNVTASDPNGPITPTVKQTDAGQQVTLALRDVVSGKGNTIPFVISFDTPDIATHNGSIWEINIPGLSSETNFQDFSVDITAPPSFGNPTFIKPDVLPIGSPLHFTGDELGKSGVSLAFGSSQTYAYTLLYHLENTNVFPIRTEIALPPTTNYQDVALDSLSPKPTNVTLDADGNWLATYTLSPSQKETITAQGFIAVALSPKPVTLSTKERAMYLEKQNYWQVDNPHIISLANNLKTPEAIYQYVVSHVTYDFSRVKNNQVRVGALGVLESPNSAVCLEFTDLFIALARAAGIPAREIDGFAYTQNTISRPLSLSQDVLHAWPEYYDDNKGAWIMVDPTWGNTTGGVDYFHQLDFDHVAFVVKGLSSTYPVPAGGYKFDGLQNQKDVSVIISRDILSNQPTIRMQLTMPQTFLSGLPITGTVVLQNTGSVLFPVQPVRITTQHLDPLQQFIPVTAIPPFGSTSQAISFAKTPFLTNTLDTITITLDGKTIQTHIAVVPVTKQFLIIGGISFAILSTIIWLITTRPWRIPVSE